MSDEKLTKRNGYQHFYSQLNNPLHGQKPILDYGLYEPVLLNAQKMKKIINKKQGITTDKVEEVNDDENEEDDENDENGDDEEDDEYE